MGEHDVRKNVCLYFVNLSRKFVTKGVSLLFHFIHFFTMIPLIVVMSTYTLVLSLKVMKRKSMQFKNLSGRTRKSYFTLKSNMQGICNCSPKFYRNYLTQPFYLYQLTPQKYRYYAKGKKKPRCLSNTDTIQHLIH